MIIGTRSSMRGIFVMPIIAMRIGVLTNNLLGFAGFPHKINRYKKRKINASPRTYEAVKKIVLSRIPI
jgi:hypothetical protein